MKKYLTIAAFLLSALGFSYQALCSDSIHLAAYHGNEEKVIELLASHPDPDARDSYGGTALHAAMFQNNTEIVRLLVDAGYDVNAVGPSNGYTPLHDAVWADNLPALKILVENGGDTRIKGLDGNTPLEKARKEGKDEIVVYLSKVQK
ncbi:ankyrin repeat domain-containing protein [Vibrio sp. JC009]|uniref:ankyrin repeat domain-containing protein n=1 Tax=Vibrio sp. JC009 TaxID=2912314 RepID=UPI0023AE724C|nr:ankyrin repeat domain-containing protein [Vibrio sp. JC009]WED23457.1 ankyrin repeat domain-containing protein [Vibrio sp. JC009]